MDVDFPDPFVLSTPSGLYAYATNTTRGDARLNVQVSRSVDGRGWTPPRDAMPNPPPWAYRRAPDVWAPEVLTTKLGYVLYFSARHASRSRPDGLTLCIGVARAVHPEGPFTPEPTPLTCGGRDGVIDPSPFRVGTETWLYMKTDGNCCDAATHILAQRLSNDGLRLLGAPITIAGVTNDEPWEGKVIEAPQMALHAGRYHLFFSANDYASSAYAVGYASCQGPVGPCKDAFANPILSSSGGRLGPGHQSLFTFRGGTYLAYHAWRDVGGPRYRALYVDELTWTPEGPRLKPPPVRR